MNQTETIVCCRTLCNIVCNLVPISLIWDSSMWYVGSWNAIAKRNVGDFKRETKFLSKVKRNIINSHWLIYIKQMAEIMNIVACRKNISNAFLQFNPMICFIKTTRQQIFNNSHYGEYWKCFPYKVTKTNIPFSCILTLSFPFQVPVGNTESEQMPLHFLLDICSV